MSKPKRICRGYNKVVNLGDGNFRARGDELYCGNFTEDGELDFIARTLLRWESDSGNSGVEIRKLELGNDAVITTGKSCGVD